MYAQRLLLMTAGLMLAALVTPRTVTAAVFENPLKVQSFTAIIVNLTRFVLYLAGFLSMLALVVGGVRLIVSGMSGNEGQIAAAKRIIFWAIMGLLVVSMAATILAVTGYILDVRGVIAPPL